MDRRTRADHRGMLARLLERLIAPTLVTASVVASAALFSASASGSPAGAAPARSGFDGPVSFPVRALDRDAETRPGAPLRTVLRAVRCAGADPTTRCWVMAKPQLEP